MRIFFYIALVIFPIVVNAQTALYNNGNLRIHDGGQLGFHTHLINDSPFDENMGMAGFYSATSLTVSGTIVPLFFDTEIATENGLFLQLGVDNANNTNFILGDILTPKNQNDIYYQFLENGFYNGDEDFTKIDGYAAISNQQHFIFPVGDATMLRPLVINSSTTNLFAKCAYFLENPDNPASFTQNFDVFNIALDLEFVSEIEFWRLEGTVPSTVTLNWNTRSDLAILTSDVTQVVVVGWSKIGNRWINLGGENIVGTLDDGFVTSESFVPDDFEIITLGVSRLGFEPLENQALSLGNYFVSTNADGINDSFEVPELEDSPNNLVKIYDRYGLKVFEKSNYTDEFVGFSNVNNLVINRDEGLPVGVYFYTIYMADLDLNYQGFLYLSR